jgi:hypothetical protein
MSEPSSVSVDRPSHKYNRSSVLWRVLGLLGACAASTAAINFAAMVEPDRLAVVRPDELWYAAALSLILAGVGLLAVQALHTGPHDRVGWFLLFFSLRTTLGVLLAFTFQFDDERGFHYAGLEQVSDVLASTGGRGYYQLVETLYRVVYPTILLPKVLNALIGAILPFLVYDVAMKTNCDRSAARRAFLLAGLMPPLIVFSAVNLKEAFTAFVLVMEVWFFARSKRTLTWPITGAVCSIALLFWLRGTPWAAVGLVGLIAFLAIRKRGDSRRLGLPARIGGVVAAGASLAVSWGAVSGDLVGTIESRLTQEAYFIERFSTSEAKVNQFLDVENPLSPKNLGVLFIRGLFSPSPARFVFDRGIDAILEMTAMLTWYGLLPFAVIGWMKAADRRLAHICGVVATTVLVLASTAVMLGGDPYRHRIAMMGLLFVLAADGLGRSLAPRLQAVVALWWIGALSFTGIWLAQRLREVNLF